MRRITLRIASGLVVMVVLYGCATEPGYEKFYEAASNVSVSAEPNSNVVVRAYKNPEEMKSAYWGARDEGAVLLGQAAWEGPYTDPERAKPKAASVGANLVLVSIEYSHTRTGTMTLPQYNPGSTTSYSTYNSGNISGYGGSAYYSGRSTTTAYSPGYTTYNYVPYSVDRYDHWAVFLRHDNSGGASASQVGTPLSIPSVDAAAIAETRKRISSDPNHPTNEFLHLIIGVKYLTYQHYPEAIGEYQAALNINPSCIHAMEQIGLALLLQGKYDEAIEQYNKMFLVRADDAGAHFGLGFCYYHGKKDWSQAERHWNAALGSFAERSDPAANYLTARCHSGLAFICYKKKSPSAGSDHAYQAGKLFIDCADRETALQMVDLIKTFDAGSGLSARLTEYIYNKEEKAPTKESSGQ